MLFIFTVLVARDIRNADPRRSSSLAGHAHSVHILCKRARVVLFALSHLSLP